MKLSTRLLLPVLALVSMATAFPHAKRQYNGTQQWQLSEVYTNQPSGRPRNYPWTVIVATITDPNETVVGRDNDDQDVRIPANNTGLNCRAIWIGGQGPYGRSWPCDNTDDIEYGYWIMEVVEVPDGSTLYRFDLKFTFQAYAVTPTSGTYSRRFEGTAQLRPGPDGNMAGGCAASGRCGWSLTDEHRPVLVNYSAV